MSESEESSDRVNECESGVSVSESEGEGVSEW